MQIFGLCIRTTHCYDRPWAVRHKYLQVVIELAAPDPIIEFYLSVNMISPTAQVLSICSTLLEATPTRRVGTNLLSWLSLAFLRPNGELNSTRQWRTENYHD